MRQKKRTRGEFTDGLRHILGQNIKVKNNHHGNVSLRVTIGETIKMSYETTFVSRLKICRKIILRHLNFSHNMILRLDLELILGRFLSIRSQFSFVCIFLRDAKTVRLGLEPKLRALQ